jgi:hypothetical protein
MSYALRVPSLPGAVSSGSLGSNNFAGFLCGLDRFMQISVLSQSLTLVRATIIIYDKY